MFKFLRGLTVLANVALIVMAVWEFSTSNYGPDIAFLVVLLVFGLLNIYFLLTGKGEDTWLGLFLKRKALEEKNKIERLDNK